MKYAAWFLAAMALALLALLDLAGQVPGNADDAFILLVYARHFAETGAFYYNAGAPALDGFSSLLDVLVKGLVLRLTGADPIQVNFWISTAALVACAVAALFTAARAVGRARGRSGRSPWMGVLGALALTLTPGLAEGTAYMLETPLFGVLLLGALASLLGERVPLSLLALCCLGLVLVRPEGAPIALLLCAGAAFGANGVERKRGLLLLAGIAGCVLALIAWRLSVFGHWAPNSYYAKTSAKRANEVADGFRYVLAHGGTFAGALLACTVPIAPLLSLSRNWSSAAAGHRFAWISGAALAALVGVVLSGGDGYAGARFLMPSFVIATGALLFAGIHLRGKLRLVPAGLLLGLAACGLQSSLDGAASKVASLRHGPMTEEHFACSREVSARLARASAGLRVGQIHFQRFKYFADDVHVFDLTGINQRDVARLELPEPVTFGKDGLDLALAAGVEVLHLDYRWSHPQPMARYNVRTLVDSPELREAFAVLVTESQGERLALDYVSASLVGVCGSQCFNVFVRRDVSEAFRAEGFQLSDG